MANVSVDEIARSDDGTRMAVVKMFAMMDFHHRSGRRFHVDRDESRRFLSEIHRAGQIHVRLRRLLETPCGAVGPNRGLQTVDARPFGFRNVERLLHESRSEERNARRLHPPALPDKLHGLGRQLVQLQNGTFLHGRPMAVGRRALVDGRRLPAAVVEGRLHPVGLLAGVIFKCETKLRADDDLPVLRIARIHAAFPCRIRHGDRHSRLRHDGHQARIAFVMREKALPHVVHQHGDHVVAFFHEIRHIDGRKRLAVRKIRKLQDVNALSVDEDRVVRIRRDAQHGSFCILQLEALAETVIRINGGDLLAQPNQRSHQ